MSIQITSTEGLKPCPLCGGPVKANVFGGRLFLFCPVCRLYGPGGARSELKDRWNRRSTSTESEPAPSTSIARRPCPCCGQLRDDPYIIRHDGLTVRACPFCGGRSRITTRVDLNGPSFHIECTKCEARGRIAHAHNDFEPNPELVRNLADEWNWRYVENREVPE